MSNGGTGGVCFGVGAGTGMWDLQKRGGATPINIPSRLLFLNLTQAQKQIAVESIFKVADQSIVKRHRLKPAKFIV